MKAILLRATMVLMLAMPCLAASQTVDEIMRESKRIHDQQALRRAAAESIEQGRDFWDSKPGGMIIMVASITMLVIAFGAICFPWWINRIKNDTIALRRELSDYHENEKLRWQQQMDAMRTQTLQLRALVDALKGAEIDRG